MPSTNENLKEAFSGESQASRKYYIWAQQAEKDGFPNVAKLFRTASEAETIHATGHLKSMDGVKSTAENLQAAIEGETYEFREMYPPMHEQAAAEGHVAKRMFAYALETEKVHADLYTQALEAVKAGQDLETSDIYLCPVCGHVEIGQPPEKCPVCNAAGSSYVQV